MASPSSAERVNPGHNLGENISYRLIALLDVVFSAIQSRIGIKGMAYLFVLPNLLIFGIFILLPMLLNFAYAFTGSNRLFLNERPYVGTRNVEQLFQCEDLLDYTSCREDDFIRAIGNTLWYVTAQVSLMVLTSLITALVLNRKLKGRAFFRSVFFYPVLLSPIVVALIWRWILQENGLFNAWLVSFGFERVSFLSEVPTARSWVVIISVWSNMGFYTLILLAGLQSIPAELYQAASIDGANNWQQFRRITLPLLMPTMLVVLVLSLIRAVQVFDIVFAFTDGGPGTATLFLVQFIYENGFVGDRRLGIAAAASLIMAGVLIVFTIMQISLRRSEGDL